MIGRVGRVLIFIISCAMVACSGNRGVLVPDIQGDTLDMRYATLLQITECKGYTVADIKNPWGDNLLNRYLLVDRDSVLPEHLPKGTLLRTPLESVLLLATVHAELLCYLNAEETVKGVCESKYMTQPFIKKALNNGSVIDCGSSLNIDIEKVVDLSPEAVFVLPYENGGYGKLDKLDYPLVECVEYMEVSPLASAEWMRFYGRLVGRAFQADSLFDVVCRNYNALRDSVSSVGYRPKLMCELKTNSAWYVPGGNSTMGVLYKDAGADYIFAENKSTGSLPLAFETVLDKASEADIWLVKYGADSDKTYSSLLAECEGYRHFAPFKQRNIYVCNLSKKRFYEETPFRPDILLYELVSLFHPYLVDKPHLKYYEKLSE